MPVVPREKIEDKPHGRRPTPSAPTLPFTEIRVPIIAEV